MPQNRNKFLNRRNAVRNRNNLKKTDARELPETAQRYTGPAKPSTFGELQDVTTKTVFVKNTGVLTTSGAGVMALLVDTNPSTCPEWANWVAAFDEYRVLSMLVEYVPNTRYQFGNGTFTIMPFYIAVDHDDNTVPAALNTVATKESSRIVNMTDPWSIAWKMSAQPNAAFVNCTSPISVGSVKGYSTGNANTAILGDTLITYLVQFRGVD